MPLPTVLLLIVVFLPLTAAVVVPVFGRRAQRPALWIALLHLAVSCAVLALTIPELNFRGETLARVESTANVSLEPVWVPGYSPESRLAVNRTSWTLLDLVPSSISKPGPRVQFFIGLDGFNVWLVTLASLMTVISILVSWESVPERAGAYHGWLFLLQGGVIGAFLSFDIILFYVFFELTLIPSFFLIGGWGNGSGRRDAARKFFLYTLAGSLLTLIGVLGIVLTNPNMDGTITFSLPDLLNNVQNKLDLAGVAAKAGNPEPLNEALTAQRWFFWLLVVGFLVKVPVWPLHTWMPAAYNESPIGVTVLLSSILSKLGAFGILRFVLTLTPDAAIEYGLPVIGWLAAIGIVYAALCACNQKDMKLTIAYSSMSHLGFLVLGLFALTSESLSGGVLHMVNHGLTIGALFALLAFLLDRYRTTQTGLYGGLMGRFPNYAILAFVLVLASIGLPGLNNFVSEMLMLAGLYNARNPGVGSLWPAAFAASGVFLSAWYMLTLMQRVFFNPPREPEAVGQIPPRDISLREGVAFGSIAVLCLALGVLPQYVLDTLRWDVNQLATLSDRARERAGVPMPKVETPAPGTLGPPAKVAAPPLKGGIPKGGPPMEGGKVGAPKGGGKGGPPKGGGKMMQDNGN